MSSHILNALSGSVYTSHRLISPAKALWTALQNKYRIEEAMIHYSYENLYKNEEFESFSMASQGASMNRLKEELLLYLHIR
ncbi:hypothetical protein FRX31_014159, partial [Thalictrum thalictroides]